MKVNLWNALRHWNLNANYSKTWLDKLCLPVLLCTCWRLIKISLSAQLIKYFSIDFQKYLIGKFLYSLHGIKSWSFQNTQYDKSIVILGVSGLFCHFYSILMENSVSKLCRPWSDTTLCGVWLGSALFATPFFIGKNRLNCHLWRSIPSTQQQSHTFMFLIFAWLK